MVSFTLYQTAQRLYIVRHSGSGAEEHWRVLNIDRTSGELAAAEDPTDYSKAQLQRLLATLHAGGCCKGWRCGRGCAAAGPACPQLPLPSA